MPLDETRQVCTVLINAQRALCAIGRLVDEDEVVAFHDMIVAVTAHARGRRGCRSLRGDALYVVFNV